MGEMNIIRPVLLAVLFGLLMGCGGADSKSFRLIKIEITSGIFRGTTQEIEYLATGQVSRQLIRYGSPNLTNTTFQYIYDDFGQQSRILYDRDSDGQPERAERFEYGENNLVTKSYEDFDMDGVDDKRVEYHYSDGYNISQKNVIGLDSEAVSSVVNYIYDENGLITDDVYNNNSSDRTDFHTYTYVDGFLREQTITRQTEFGLTTVISFVYTYEEAPCVYPEPASLNRHYCFYK